MKKIYLTGIGGVGMSSLALYLQESGYQVSGSDVADFRLKTLLESKGIIVYLQHREEQIEESELLIYSTAVPLQNPEIQQAIMMKIPILNRLEALQLYLDKQQIIAVTGSYGKSTTTTFTTSLMNQAGFSPSWLIGADLFSFPPAGKKESLWTVLETDESKPVFLDFHPYGVILTNIGNDHLQNYDNSPSKLTQQLLEFIKKRNKKTKVVLHGDEKNISPILDQLDRNQDVILCGIDKQNDYIISSVETKITEGSFATSFLLTFPDGSTHYCSIPMPGVKNVIDAVLAVAMTIQLGGDRKTILEGLPNLPRMDRRFEICRYSKASIVVDDEGDSPDVIKQVLQNGKEWYPDKKLLAVLQPHRFSRLKNLFKEYGEVMSKYSDEMVILPVYSAGEKEISGINSQTLCESIQDRGYPSANVQVLKIDQAITLLQSKLDQDYLIITLGPGDVWKIANALKKQ